MTAAPPPPQVRLNLGVTGHRDANAALAGNAARVEAVLGSVLDIIAAAVAGAPQLLGTGSIAPTRLHSLLSDGADQIVADMALARGWDLASPLPFGHRLNAAINAQPATLADARALLAGKAPRDPAVAARAQAIAALSSKATVFELADQDPAITALFLARMAAPKDYAKASLFDAEASVRVALAGTLLIQQSDLILGVWDATTTAHGGGTGHTIAAALDLGAPVIWIDPAEPEAWRILRAPEALAGLRSTPAPLDREAELIALVSAVLAPAEPSASAQGAARRSPGVAALNTGQWRDRSNPLTHAYRRVEALFGGGRPFRRLTQTYEAPEDVAAGSGRPMLEALAALPGADLTLAPKIEADILRRFAWADGISAHLSDSYRGGMVVNFLLSAFAIVGGISYMPFATSDDKCVFSVFELVLLSAILTITFLGDRRRWHGRWFETRRVAEYLRHSPLLLALGVARAPGRWPRGAETSWPEWYARQTLRGIGLPQVAITPAYLRAALTDLLDDHVVRQRDYHTGKAGRLTQVHHNLDRFSEFLFQLAVISVAIYLAIKGAGALDMIDHQMEHAVYRLFTFLGVLFPTFGGAIAGIRYFGDFERFAAISEVTAGKLDAVHSRISLLLQAPDETLSYGRVAELAHAADDIVVSEIENWQAVFGGKHITVPV